MKVLFCFLIVIVFVGAGCKTEEEVSEEQGSAIHTGMRTVKVLDKLDAPNYSYILVSENDNEFWIAVPTMDVEKGEILYFSKSMEMKNFRSETLDKTFESVLFVDDISKTSIKHEADFTHPEVRTTEKEKINITPVSGGKTVEQVYNEKQGLSGKSVTVKGKVVKYNSGILNRNWIHIQDGTGDAGTHDLVVTSNQSTKVGDIITIEGIVTLNKDFGSGYVYDVIIENAKLKTD